MLIYVFDYEVKEKREQRLVAVDAHGNECTVSLLHLLTDPVRYKDTEADPSASYDYPSCFFPLNSEGKEYYNTTCDYAISKDMYNRVVKLIRGGWNDIVSCVADTPATESNVSRVEECIPETFAPKTVIRYLF